MCASCCVLQLNKPTHRTFYWECSGRSRKVGKPREYKYNLLREPSELQIISKISINIFDNSRTWKELMNQKTFQRLLQLLLGQEICLFNVITLGIVSSVKNGLSFIVTAESRAFRMSLWCYISLFWICFEEMQCSCCCCCYLKVKLKTFAWSKSLIHVEQCKKILQCKPP